MVESIVASAMRRRTIPADHVVNCAEEANMPKALHGATGDELAQEGVCQRGIFIPKELPCWQFVHAQGARPLVTVTLLEIEYPLLPVS